MHKFPINNKLSPEATYLLGDHTGTSVNPIVASTPSVSGSHRRGRARVDGGGDHMKLIYGD